MSPDGFLASSELLVPAPNAVNQGGLISADTSWLAPGEKFFFLNMNHISFVCLFLTIPHNKNH